MNKNTVLAGADTPGHHLLQAPSFPEGSIRQDGSGAWRCRNLDFAHYRSDDGGTYVGLRAAQRIWQDVELPVGGPDDEEEADCVLGGRYNASWFDECTLTVYQLEGDQEQAELYRKPMRGNPPGPQTPILADPTWHQLTPEAVAIPPGVKRIRVALETPGTPQAALLYVRDVRLTWRLPAFGSAGGLRLIVDPQGANIQQDAPPFKLFHGATHRLEAKVSAGDTWDGQKASLLWRSEGVGLPVQYGVEADPVLNIDDSDQEDRYQVLSNAAPATWQLLADSDPQLLSGALTVGLGSYWHAPLHGLDLSIGDGRYEVAKVVWDGVVPIIEQQNTTVLTATLSNPFAPARLPQGREVAWLLDGREYQRTTSNADGVAQLRYSPKAGEQGADNRVEFTVACVDELGQRSQQVLNFPVFEETPWLEELEVLLDGRPLAGLEGSPLINLFAGTHDLLLRPRRPDSYFDGKPIRLQWPDDGAAQRGISFTPTTEQSMTAGGIHWTLQSGSECGDFLLEAVQASLGTPLSLAGAQLSTQIADHVELRLDDLPVKPDDLKVFRRRTPHKVQLMPKAESPLAQGGYEAWLTFVEDSFAEDGLKSEPAYGHKRALDSRGLEWVLTGQEISGGFTLQCHVERLRTSLALTDNVLLSQNANDDYEFWSDDGSPGRFEAGRINRIKLEPKLSYVGMPLFSSLYFLPGSVTSASAFPNYGVPNHSLASWVVEPYGYGTFTLQAEVPGYDERVTMACTSVLTGLEDELALTFDGMSVEHHDWLRFTNDQTHEVAIVAREGSALDEANLLIALEYHVMDSPGELQVTITPSSAREMTADGLKWSVKANGQAGTHLKLRFVVSDAGPALEVDAAISNT
ncbi:hypothetical protein KSS93_16045 [Pseudomonas xanthosomatis]|uniref:hypothetical protein n=1 Tax=Pseudomonas xanthosomatis TaxID=2842356 RepID=UPI001C3E34AA|nr:hypothetical protein [Pseudomonas xanthosomatis]QXH44399.1 hypothetical protein KSS93_16045 [Pseudomonas xanthosomatis]